MAPVAYIFPHEGDEYFSPTENAKCNYSLTLCKVRMEIYRSVCNSRKLAITQHDSGRVVWAHEARCRLLTSVDGMEDSCA